ncbi:MAG: hypothetical protein SGI99_12780 [Pseudomonadota bacterium]|nr:hypothetical protein [Pseudomonadota bacterium]
MSDDLVICVVGVGSMPQSAYAPPMQDRRQPQWALRSATMATRHRIRHRDREQRGRRKGSTVKAIAGPREQMQPIAIHSGNRVAQRVLCPKFRFRK